MQLASPSAKAERRAAILSLVVGIILLMIKFAAYFKTNSAAIFSDAVESIVNVIAGGFALYSVILAHHPADRDHPYGHGKIEFLSAGFEGGMIILAALFIAAHAVEKLIYGAAVQNADIGLVLLAIAMLANGGLGIYLIQIGRRSQSFTLEADGRHLFADAMTSVAVLIALAAVKITKLDWIDPVAAIVVAIYITLMAGGLLRRSAAGLMDEQDHADDAMIRGILNSHIGPGNKAPTICSFHKLRHRHSGRYHWVDFHILVPAELNIAEGHRIASAIEYEIELALGEGNATAHVEPCQMPE
ncbi:MAG TPA: cation diffusion facilitator family transporter, partial [Tepidisphaeraceae bacterium]|nr:cation diffusion facilitator family transporter [Tepidisphaeraceae bacterium]